MNKTVKKTAAISGVSLTLLLFHIYHLAHTTVETGTPAIINKQAATIIFKDSLGRMDTMLLEDYLIKHP